MCGGRCTSGRRNTTPRISHRRAKLLACTEAGYWAIRKIALAQRPWADRVAGEVGTDALQGVLATTRKLTEVLESDVTS